MSFLNNIKWDADKKYCSFTLNLLKDECFFKWVFLSIVPVYKKKTAIIFYINNNKFF